MNSVYDIACFAEEFGICYNSFIEMMEKDDIIPFYEQKYLSIYLGIGKSYGWSEEVCKVFDAYVEKNGEQNLTD